MADTGQEVEAAEELHGQDDEVGGGQQLIHGNQTVGDGGGNVPKQPVGEHHRVSVGVDHDLKHNWVGWMDG